MTNFLTGLHNLWPISLLGFTCAWRHQSDWALSFSGSAPLPADGRFFCIDRPCWAHRLCFSSRPGWFGCRAGSGIWQGPDARTAGALRTSLFLYVRKQASSDATTQWRLFALTRRRASSSLSWLSSLIGKRHLAHTHSRGMWYPCHHTLSIHVDWCDWAKNVDVEGWEDCLRDRPLWYWPWGGMEMLNLVQCGTAGFERLDNSNLWMAGAGTQVRESLEFLRCSQQGEHLHEFRINCILITLDAISLLPNIEN